MKKRADIAVYDPDRNLQLVVEVKNQPEASVEWATQMRRNLLRYEVVPNAPYFLLALPESFYLWNHSKVVGDEVPPDYVVDATRVLTTYYGTLPWSLNQLGQFGWEMLMTDWLRDLVSSKFPREPANQELVWLFDSGLYEAIKEGAVVVEI
jgi:hypothetical protein